VKVPTALAVGVWAASGLAVLTYTYIAFKETANGLESGAMVLGGNAINPLVSAGAILASEEIAPPEKNLERNLFRKSGGNK
jgi:hypothetical protein